MQTSVVPLEKFSEKYHIDPWFVHVTEKIFEGLPEGEFEKFPYESIFNLPVGLDLDMVKSKFHYKLLMDENYGSIKYCNGNKKCEDAIKKCAELFKVGFSKIDKSAARSAESAAWSDAWSAARSAESAAWSDAWSAESAAWSDAWSAHYVWMRDILIELISEK